MAPTDEQIRLAIAQQAAEWFVAHRTSPLDDEGRVTFVAWLKTSPVHVDEYLRMAAISGELRLTAQDPQLPVAAWVAEAASEIPGAEAPNAAGSGSHHGAPNVIPLRPSPKTHGERRAGRWLSGWRLAGALAIPASVLAAFLVSFLFGGTPARAYETAHGEQRTWRLPDGTTLRLNTDSAVEVRISGTERLVDLSRGQAFFEVPHDLQRRFRVNAGGAEIIAVGTQFDVYRYGRTVQVTVLAGRVAVLSGSVPSPVSGAALPAGTLHLAAGQRLRLVDGVIEGRPTSVDVHDAEAWLRGQIAFEQRPLGEVAAEFSRYAPVPIEIDDPSLRAVPVSGVFDARDAESFLAFLRARKDVVIERSPTRVRVFKRTAASDP